MAAALEERLLDRRVALGRPLAEQVVQEAHGFQELDRLSAFTVPDVPAIEEALEHIEGKFLGLLDIDRDLASVRALLVLFAIEVNRNLDLVGEVTERPGQASATGYICKSNCATHHANLPLSYSQPLPILF